MRSTAGLLLAFLLIASSALGGEMPREGLSHLPDQVQAQVKGLLATSSSVVKSCDSLFRGRTFRSLSEESKLKQWYICARSDLSSSLFRQAVEIACSSLKIVDPWEDLYGAGGMAARFQFENSTDGTWWIVLAASDVNHQTLYLLKVIQVSDRPISLTDPNIGPKRDTPPQIPTLTYATGFAVGPDGVILTANHVVAGANSVRAKCGGEEFSDAVVVANSSVSDLAVLKVLASTPTYMSLASPKSSHVGQAVFTVGFPVREILGEEPKYSEGTVNALSGPGNEASLMQISIPIQPGNSGGPVVSFAGEVVGIVASTAAVEMFLNSTGTLPQNMNWAVKADYARTLFDSPTRSSSPLSREEAIVLTTRAVCLIEAKTGAP